MSSGNAGGGGGGSGRRTQRTIRDAIKTIQPQVFKEQLSDTSDIVGTRKLAPRTKKAMRNHLFEHLDNYFVHPGRKIAGRPLQKLVERQFDAVRREMKSKAAEDDERKSMEPLNDDLRTSNTKDVPGLVIDVSPAAKLNLFPKRNPGDVRKSYVKRTPKRKTPLPMPIFGLPNHNTPKFGNEVHISFIEESTPTETVVTIAPETLIMAPPPSYSTRSRSRSRSPIKAMASPPLPQSDLVRHVLISGEDQVPMKIELTHIPQYSNEISVDQSVIVSDSNSINNNVLDLSDLIQSNNDTHIDGKIEIASSELVLCTSIDEMNQVIVMGENGERYRFVALNDGQVSLVPEDSAVQ
ncbi:uncharacterized protein LOC110853757 [Folsomia candida]|uniref:uncharacterized protein LOC110853757 n=1 Tax=Folsomia candida TaxID=158441 RepID=UPI000B903786|nr:uncharacterized protein LOC110853757 [Folsomia candida]